ncbi:MAG: Sb-PDE family phosphodiesterase [Bacteroidales bacterium]|nr:Sb-PDE family phosphodiesterase [Bacteroidales bacterium]
MKRLITIVLLITTVSFTGLGQRKIVNLPDLPGYVTLKCDFHMHTVFSDGNVWPTVRVGEAFRDGLDAIAITDHLEYLPKKDFIPVDHNAAWKVAEGVAKEFNLILVHGAEIGRSMPPGHMNALFIQDANLLAVDSVMDAYEAAVKQGAFIQWNHPGWKSQQPDGIPRMYSIHQKLIQNGWLHGVEFFNSDEYYPLVMTFCKQYNLAVMANSDNHGVISEKYVPPVYTNRPMTLVFAKARTHDALREAMFAGRTLAYFKDMIAGKVEYAQPFFYQCISVSKPFFGNDRNIYFEVTNRSDIPFYLVNGVANAPASITLAANAVTRVAVSKKVTDPLVYDVKNVITGENEVLKIELKY